MTHRPGPWHVGVRQAEQIVYDENGWAVANATVHHGESKIPESKANARLTAAAPDLLKNLTFLVAAAQTEPGMSIYKAHIAKAVAAIAKAKGE